MPIHDLQYDSESQPYYIMKFIQGESLDAAVKRFHEEDHDPKRDPGERSLALRDLLNRFVVVCNTIAYVHTRGVLHRDLKPQNIMLGKYGETLVVDWGLAKSFERSDEARATGEESVEASNAKEGDQETRTGDVKGSPSYMSPEQATGRIEDVGPPSDIFGLGATLYAILTGSAPFQGSNPLAKASRYEFEAPRQVKPEVPAGLEGVCLKAMALKPEDRYGSAKALANDVERWLADEAVLAFREPWETRIERWVKRHLLVAALVQSLALLALYFIGWKTRLFGVVRTDPQLYGLYLPILALLILGSLWLRWLSQKSWWQLLTLFIWILGATIALTIALWSCPGTE